VKVAIRRAVPADAGSLRVLARASKAYWGYSEAFMSRWDYDREITERFVATRRVFCAEADGELAGFYALCPDGPGFRLEHLWVAPERIGRGVGSALFEHALEQASSAGASSVVVHADPNAAAFYERMGARRVGEIHDAKVQQVFPVLELKVRGGPTSPGRC
jgi:GNAT superfamily N-acetyltransferase